MFKPQRTQRSQRKRQLHQCYCVDKLWPFNPHIRSESFASEVQSDSGEIAANAVERSPEIRGLVVGVVQDDG